MALMTDNVKYKSRFLKRLNYNNRFVVGIVEDLLQARIVSVVGISLHT